MKQYILLLFIVIFSTLLSDQNNILESLSNNSNNNSNNNLNNNSSNNSSNNLNNNSSNNSSNNLNNNSSNNLNNNSNNNLNNNSSNNLNNNSSNNLNNNLNNNSIDQTSTSPTVASLLASDETSPPALDLLNLENNYTSAALENRIDSLNALYPNMKTEREWARDVEDELKITRQLFDGEDPLYQFKKKTQINDYYNKRAIAYSQLFKRILLFLVPILIISYLMNKNTIPSRIGSALIIVLLVLCFIFTFSMYIDINSRDNMNFNKYAYGDPDETNRGGGGNNDSDGDRPCLNDNCCSEGLYYWKKKGDPKSLCHRRPNPNANSNNNNNNSNNN